MAFFGDLLGVAHVLKRAYDLYEGCAAAPQEIRLAREHIHAMALCLEGVRSDLLNNPRSFVHQHNDIARTRTHSLKVHVGTCESALKRMEGLLKKYQGFKGTHVSLWNRFRWSMEGKKEIAECKSDLVLATSLLDMFLSKENLNVLWKLEGMIEVLTNRMAALEVFDLPFPATGQKRPRAQSNVTRTIVVSLVLARLRKILRTYRRKKTSAGKKPHPGPRRPKAAMRTNSGFAKNMTRNNLLHSYASDLANSTPPPPYTSKPSNPRPRPRTPSPDFHYFPGGTSTSPIPRPIRRSSSLSRLTNRLNTKVGKPIRATEYYECWKVGVGTLAFGAKSAPVFVPHKRGQMQLHKMGEVFKEASEFDNRALTERDTRVKLLLKKKNSKEGKGGKKWHFVSGRVVKRDPGRTGMLSVEKAFVVLVRR